MLDFIHPMIIIPFATAIEMLAPFKKSPSLHCCVKRFQIRRRNFFSCFNVFNCNNTHCSISLASKNRASIWATAMINHRSPGINTTNKILEHRSTSHQHVISIGIDDRYCRLNLFDCISAVL